MQDGVVGVQIPHPLNVQKKTIVPKNYKVYVAITSNDLYRFDIDV